MPITFEIDEGFDYPESRKKRLGQYFSGQPVSKLLVSLASQRKIKSVVDPMAGRGDMLLAAQDVIPGNLRLDGVEIDPLAHTEGLLAIKGKPDSQSSYLLGSAFDSSIIGGLCNDGYDLVATNPPYVRYQAQKESAGINVKLPSAVEVRAGLRDCIKKMTILNASDQAAFLCLTEGYSGLSDLAVPSWILCAALVKPGGTLAMVVPESWMKRDYAAVVRYILLRWFQIEYVVEDAHAVWFAGTQVKTSLLVARRIKDKGSIRDWKDESYVHISLPSNLATADSLIGKTYFASSRKAEQAFASHVKTILQTKSNELLDGIDFQRILIADQAATVVQMAAKKPWFASLEPRSQHKDPSYILPPHLVSLFEGYCALKTLGELGLDVGQGLRTGANEFFYVSIGSVEKNHCEVSLSKLFHSESVIFPSSCLMPVVRKQTDVAQGGMMVDMNSLTGAVLALQQWALPEDAKGTNYQVLPSRAASHLRRAARTAVTNGLIPSLSAVKTNARNAKPRASLRPRFWYMLPDFASRHSPDLFVARVNSETPRVLLNPGRQALVDANFSTLWLRDNSKVTVKAFLAYLNSSIAVALYEYTGAVMGGGALKLEATHLRTMPVPDLPERAWGRLEVLGDKLANSSANERSDIVREIDILICKEMYGAACFENKLAELQAVVLKQQTARIRKNSDVNRREQSPAVFS